MPNIQRVAVLGAGVSGVSAAVHLKRAGLEVTVYERGNKAGGVWVYDDRTAPPAPFPSMVPSIGDSPEYASLLADSCTAKQHDSDAAHRQTKEDSPMATDDNKTRVDDMALLHAPPGPCYASLKNNVSTTEMELRTNRWPEGIEDFVSHAVLAEYIQETARVNEIESDIRFGSRVNRVEKEGSRWVVETSRLVRVEGSLHPVVLSETFDAVVVATGHYHACKIPDTPGLRDWHRQWPDRITHSKSYRNPRGFENQNVLIVGSGVSAWDIARDISPVANRIYQVSRGGAYDLPASIFPETTIRIGGVESFSPLNDSGVRLAEDGSLPGTVRLTSGHTLCNIHRVVLCTGYHMSYPFLSTHHSDTLSPEDADAKVLVTKDGQRTHNLHKDIFYIPDPTLAFIGVPYHVATFSLFEFQAMAVAAVFAGRAELPQEREMRDEYERKTAVKGAGRAFHSLKGYGEEIGYVEELVGIVNQGAEERGEEKVEPHTRVWKEAYERRVVRMKALIEQAGERLQVPLDELVVPCW